MKDPVSISSSTPVNNWFTVVGLNYKKADAQLRGLFSLSAAAQQALLKDAASQGIGSLSILSTCNRTELYGMVSSPEVLIDLICRHTKGEKAQFLSVSYTLVNKEAVTHLFNVGTGLDSQILGDFEIISQLRNSFRISKSIKLLDPFMERLINEVIRASKRIKNETQISSGATSVSFAAVQYIMARVPYVNNKNILLFGTGKIGRNTCENLIKHTQNDHIVLINRTKEKAQKVAGKFNLVVKDYANIEQEIAKADILIVATGAQNPTISKSLLHLSKPLLILDLSIPKNVADNVQENPLVHLVHLDQLSSITDHTLSQRAAHIPKAQSIIESLKEEFFAWAEKRKHAPTIKALKDKLLSLKEAELAYQRKKLTDFNEEQATIISDRIIHKITTQFANHLNAHSADADKSQQLIKKVFDLDESTT
ncbi:MAG: glutamyl-tRNA reductase [Gilvibacter sp.]